MPSDPATSSPDPDAFAAPASSPAAVLSAILSPTPSRHLTADLLASASAPALYHLLPLLLSALQFVGECTPPSARPTLLSVLSALRARLLTDPVLRQRFLLHAAHPSFSAYWRVAQTDADSEPGDGEGENRGIDVEHFDDGDPDAEIPAPDEQEPEQESEDEEEDDGHGHGDGNDSTLVDRKLDSSRRVVKQVSFSLPCDAVDLASRTFWQRGVYPSTDGEHFESGHQFTLPSDIINPFFRAHDAPPGAAPRCAAARVAKVFSSIARPLVVALDAPPGVLVKRGDNLMQDLGVMHVVHALNHAWAGDERIAARYSKAPVATWYDVIPSGIDTGLMQAVAGLTSLREFDWDAWARDADGDEDRILDTIRTAAGSYIATYIIGGRDRHFDNILVKDGYQVLHIDFTYILGSKPALDAPPISLAAEMYDAFERLGCWDSFLDLCSLAFASARANASSVLRAARLAFARTGLDDKAVSRFLRGKRSMNLAAVDDDAVEYVARQCRNGPSNFQTWVKRFAHDNVDPAWYGLLKKGFPPAVAVMSWLDQAENAEAKKLAQELKDQGDMVEDEEMINV